MLDFGLHSILLPPAKLWKDKPKPQSSQVYLQHRRVLVKFYALLSGTMAPSKLVTYGKAQEVVEFKINLKEH